MFRPQYPVLKVRRRRSPDAQGDTLHRRVPSVKGFSRKFSRAPRGGPRGTISSPKDSLYMLRLLLAYASYLPALHNMITTRLHLKIISRHVARYAYPPRITIGHAGLLRVCGRQKMRSA